MQNTFKFDNALLSPLLLILHKISCRYTECSSQQSLAATYPCMWWVGHEQGLTFLDPPNKHPELDTILTDRPVYSSS